MDEDKSLEALETELQAKSNDDAQDLGIESAPTATDTDTSAGGEQEDYKALLEAERKERLKVEQERNLLRNKQKEAEKARLDAVNKDELESVKAAYEELLAERQEREAAEEEAENARKIESFREDLIGKRSEAVQKAARALIAKNKTNLAWADAQDEVDAARQVNDQLDALETVLGVQSPEVETPSVHPNNPNARQEGKRFEDLSLEEMEKELGRADVR